MMPYERLRAWRDCHALALAVYKTTAEFPHHELYGLISQARRAAVSAAANIAEGSATRGPRDYCRFLNIALRSLSELSYLLLLGKDLEYISVTAWQELNALRDKAGKLTWNLYTSLQKRSPLS